MNKKTSLLTLLYLLIFIIMTSTGKTEKLMPLISEEYIYITSWKSELDDKSFGPADIAIDSEGYVYITDFLNKCIQKFNSNGR